MSRKLHRQNSPTAGVQPMPDGTARISSSSLKRQRGITLQVLDSAIRDVLGTRIRAKDCTIFDSQKSQNAWNAIFKMCFSVDPTGPNDTKWDLLLAKEPKGLNGLRLVGLIMREEV